MNTPSPKPTEIAKPMPQIAKCPACKVNGLDSTCTVLDGVVSCNWCIYQCGVTTSEPMQPYDDEEAVRIHNALCRPAPETQAVAPVESVPVSELEKLVEEWRGYRETGMSPDGVNYAEGYNAALDGCADRLSAVIRGMK